MSISRPFFNTSPTKYQPNVPEYDKAEHWSKTLERRPVGQKYGKGYAEPLFQGDFDTRIDNWDDDNEPQDKQ